MAKEKSEWRYEDTLTVDALKAEARDGWETELAFNNALSELPIVPPFKVLKFLAGYGGRDNFLHHWEIGKKIQREHEGIPFKTEYECAAGLWSEIRDGLLCVRRSQ